MRTFNRKIKRRIISIILSISLALCSIPAYANSDYQSSSNYISSFDKKLISEIEFISNGEESLQIEGNCWEINYLLEDGKQGYAKKEYKGGSEIYFFKEGNIENTIIKSSNGTYYLDGKKVQMNRNSYDRITDHNETDLSNETRGKHYNVTSYDDVAPSGTSASEYNTYVLYEEIDVDFNNFVQSLTVGAIVTLLSGGLLAVAEAGYVVGILVSLGTGVLSSVALDLMSNHPLSRGSKIGLTRYQRNDGYRIPSVITGEMRYAYKDLLNYYAQTNSGSYVMFDTDCRYRLTRIYS